MRPLNTIEYKEKFKKHSKTHWQQHIEKILAATGKTQKSQAFFSAFQEFANIDDDVRRSVVVMPGQSRGLSEVYEKFARPLIDVALTLDPEQTLDFALNLAFSKVVADQFMASFDDIKRAGKTIGSAATELVDVFFDLKEALALAEAELQDKFQPARQGRSPNMCQGFVDDMVVAIRQEVGNENS